MLSDAALRHKAYDCLGSPQNNVAVLLGTPHRIKSKNIIEYYGYESWICSCGGSSAVAAGW